MKTTNGVLNDEAFEKMQDWNISDVGLLQCWIEMLEHYNVFFSAPLDIDFLMLEHYGGVYKGLLEENEGSRLVVEKDGQKNQKCIKDIEASETVLPEYRDRITEDVRHTLKACGGDGKTYSNEQKRLMVWYTYFFLKAPPHKPLAKFRKIRYNKNMKKQITDLLRKVK